MDNASVIASFPEELRQEVLLSADESVLATLPEALQAEARTLRERHAAHMQQFRAAPARAAAEAAAAGGSGASSPVPPGGPPPPHVAAMMMGHQRGPPPGIPPGMAPMAGWHPGMIHPPPHLSMPPGPWQGH